jgi:hypothetical protein
MRYPSLANVNFIVVDGRKWTSESAAVIQGAVMALSDHFNYHVLVAASSDSQARKVEAIGESSGVDMYLHAEVIESSEEFMERCSNAKVVVFPKVSPNQRIEILELISRGTRLILSEKLEITGLRPDAVILFKPKNAIDVLKALRTIDFIS